MSIPHFTSADIVSKSVKPAPRRRFKIPVAPFEIVLLSKLQGWNEHRLSHVPYYKSKQYADVDRIRNMLKISPKFIDCESLPPDFFREAQEQVYTFVRQHPNTKASWRDLGFSVRRPSNHRR